MNTEIQTWEWEGGALEAAKNAELGTFLPSILTRDYALMDEATRRLVDGTCCLINEEKISVFELFSKLKAALMDHVRFEEGTVFKSLNQNAPGIENFVYAMKVEHRELIALITEATKALEESHGIGFRVILREFLTVFRRHRKLETPFWYKQRAQSCSDENLERMRLRTREAAL